MKTNKNLMGSQVVVTKKFVRKLYVNEHQDSSSVEKWWEEEEIEWRKGWIVGFRKLSNLCFESEAHDVGNGEKILISKVPCVLVCFWPTEKPIRVPLDGFIEKPGPCWWTEEEKNLAISWWNCSIFCSSGFGNTSLNRDMNKDNLKCRISKQERDIKGRFV